jgi:hypothetical protein
MINPSIIGWIDKFFKEQNCHLRTKEVKPEYLYQKIRKTGFIYGHIVSLNTSSLIETAGWTQNELSKVALINNLYSVYDLYTKESSTTDFVTKAVAFYNVMTPQGFNLLKKIMPDDSLSVQLEKNIDSRVQPTIDIINKQFSHIATNALLFIDVLAFQHYIANRLIPFNYVKKLEEAIISTVSLALKTKTIQSNYDDLLIKLFESSVRYSSFSEVKVKSKDFKLEELQLDYFGDILEKQYLVDLSSLALYSDRKIENNEAYFLYQLGDLLGLQDVFVRDCFKDIDAFITTYKNEIPYFNYSNPVKHFYDQTTQTVIKLITRNKKRIVNEIVESKELMVLLAYSTRRDLTEKEKKKVKGQLLDIFKSIPSLAIFLLPGGSLLLPIVIKLIPSLLPSSFNENLKKEE